MPICDSLMVVYYHMRLGPSSLKE